MAMGHRINGQGGRHPRGRLPLPRLSRRDPPVRGPEFTGWPLDERVTANEARPVSIQPGRPTQSGYAESFDCQFRDECGRTVHSATWSARMEPLQPVTRAIAVYGVTRGPSDGAGQGIGSWACNNPTWGVEDPHLLIEILSLLLSTGSVECQTKETGIG